MTSSFRFLSPSEMARRLKVSTKALRIYETHGLVRPLRTSAGWRAYGPDQIARLHQVLALKHLGLPLRRISVLLADQLNGLDTVLAIQQGALRQRKAEAERGLLLLAAARRRLAKGGVLSADDLIQLTQETVMTNQLTDQEWRGVFDTLGEKHFTPQERAQLAAKGYDAGAPPNAVWTALTEEAEGLMRKGDSGSPEAMNLARRWMTEVGRYTDRDPEMNRKLRAMWQEAFQDPDFKERAPTSPELMAFIGEAYAKAVEAGVATYP